MFVFGLRLIVVYYCGNVFFELDGNLCAELKYDGSWEYRLMVFFCCADFAMSDTRSWLRWLARKNGISAESSWALLRMGL